MQKTLVIALCVAAAVLPAQAGAILFSTGAPDGKIATLSAPATGGQLETETADDFVLGQSALITGATFTGLLVGTTAANVNDLAIDLYNVFPVDSASPPDGRVTSRTNSPSDSEFATFDSLAGSLSYSVTVLSPSFTASNSVVTGVHPIPNQFTGGEGPVTGEEVEFMVTFTTPFLAGATDHDFFSPEVGVTGGNFLWLSAPKPISSPGTALQFSSGSSPDLQSWIRSDGTLGLAPDWERVGTDVTGQGPYNASFSLSGDVVPEPSTALQLAIGLLGLGMWSRKRLSASRPGGQLNTPSE